MTGPTSADERGGWTPGPWEYRPFEHDDWGVVRGAPDAHGNRYVVANARNGGELSKPFAQHRDDGTDPYEANARLIAAAPDLFEALRALLDACEHEANKDGGVYGPKIGFAAQAAERALTRAQGRPDHG